MKKKVFGVVLAIVAVAAIIIGIGQPWNTLTGNNTTPTAAPTIDPANLVTVTGVIGSEKSNFFKDPRVIDELAKQGYVVNVSTAGSRDIATTVDLSKYDFAFPSSASAAKKIQEKLNTTKAYSPFYSPMAIFTWEPVIEVLEQNGIASKDSTGTWEIIDAKKLVDVINAGTRWNELTGASALYPSNRGVLITSTDIRTSNSAGMYMAIASYVLNGDTVISSQAEQDAVMPALSSLFIKQGYSAESSAEPFGDYLAQGMGAKPMVIGYEAQFIEQNVINKTLPQGAVIAYLDPTVYSKHEVVPVTDNGDKIGQLLVNDPVLQELAAEHGFRTNDATTFGKVISDNKVPGIQENIVDVADTPSYDTMESMIEKISTLYQQ